MGWNRIFHRLEIQQITVYFNENATVESHNQIRDGFWRHEVLRPMGFEKQARQVAIRRACRHPWRAIDRVSLPRCVPAEPDCVPAEPGCVPAEPGCVPAEPGCVPAEPGCVPAEPGCVPAEPESVFPGTINLILFGTDRCKTTLGRRSPCLRRSRVLDIPWQEQ